MAHPVIDKQRLLVQCGYAMIGMTEADIRDLGDGTYIMVKRLMFHWTLIRGQSNDYHGYFDRWCYNTDENARRALHDWPEGAPPDYEPTGWHRHPNTGRRRTEGDPSTEYLDP